MSKSATNSKDTASSTDTVSSNAPSELFDLERDIPTTEGDVRMQRKLHGHPGENLLPGYDALLNPRQFENILPRRTTSKGWEAFELD